MSQSEEEDEAAAAARSRRAGAAASHHRAGRYEEAAALLEASLADFSGGDGGDGGGGDGGGDRGGGGLSPPRDDAASVADRLDRAAAEHNLGLAREGMRAAALRRRRRRRRRRAEAGGGAAAGSAPSSASSTSEADAGADADADAGAGAGAGADADAGAEDAEDGDEGPAPCFLRAADLYREAQAALAGGRVRDAALREYDDEAAAASAAAAGRGGAEAAPAARWACPERGAALSLLAAAGACAREGDVDGAVACHEEVVGLLLGEDEAEAEAEAEGEGEGEGEDPGTTTTGTTTTGTTTTGTTTTGTTIGSGRSPPTPPPPPPPPPDLAFVRLDERRRLRLIAGSLGALGRIHALRGEDGDALGSYRDALELLRSVPEPAGTIADLLGGGGSGGGGGRGPPGDVEVDLRDDVARNLLSLGTLHGQRGEGADAVGCCAEALGILSERHGDRPDQGDGGGSVEEGGGGGGGGGGSGGGGGGGEGSKDPLPPPGPRHPAILTALHALGRAHFLSGSYDVALACYGESLGGRRGGGGEGEDGMAVADVLVDMSSALQRRGDLGAALERNDQAVRTYRLLARGGEGDSNPGQDDGGGGSGDGDGDVDGEGRARRHLAGALQNRGALLLEHHMPEAALDCYAESLELTKISRGRNHPEVARLWAVMGDASIARERFDDAKDCYAGALEVYRRSGMSEDASPYLWMMQKIRVIEDTTEKADRSDEEFMEELEGNFFLDKDEEAEAFLAELESIFDDEPGNDPKVQSQTEDEEQDNGGQDGFDERDWIGDAADRFAGAANAFFSHPQAPIPELSFTVGDNYEAGSTHSDMTGSIGSLSQLAKQLRAETMRSDGPRNRVEASHDGTESEVTFEDVGVAVDKLIAEMKAATAEGANALKKTFFRKAIIKQDTGGSRPKERKEKKKSKKERAKDIFLMKKSLMQQKAEFGVRSERVANTLTLLGGLYLKEGDLDSVLAVYSDELEIRRHVHGHGHFAVADTLNRIGSIHLQKDGFDAAKQAHIEALRIQQKLLGANAHNQDVSKTLVSLGAVYYKERNSLKNIQSVDNDDYDSFVESGMLCRIAFAHDERGEYVMAMHFYDEHVEVMKNKGKNKFIPGIIGALNCLGSLNRKMGRYVESIDYHTKALNMQKSVPDELDRIEVTNTSVLLGMAELKAGRFQKAHNILKDSLPIQQSKYGKNKPIPARTIFHLGLIHDALADNARAMTCLQTALAIQKKALSLDHPDTLTTRVEIARLQSSAGDQNRAMTGLLGVLLSQQQLFGSKHPCIADTLHSIGIAHHRKGNMPSALKSYEQCFAIRKEMLGYDHPETGSVLNSIGAVHASRKRNKKALPIYEAALKIRREALGNKHVDVARTLSNLGVAYAALERFAEATEVFAEARTIRLNALGKLHPAVADSHVNIGNVHMRQCSFGEARNEFESALFIYERSKVRKDDPRIARVRATIERVKRNEGLLV